MKYIIRPYNCPSLPTTFFFFSQSFYAHHGIFWTLFRTIFRYLPTWSFNGAKPHGCSFALGPRSILSVVSSYDASSDIHGLDQCCTCLHPASRDGSQKHTWESHWLLLVSIMDSMFWRISLNGHAICTFEVWHHHSLCFLVWLNKAGWRRQKGGERQLPRWEIERLKESLEGAKYRLLEKRKSHGYLEYRKTVRTDKQSRGSPFLWSSWWCTFHVI